MAASTRETLGDVETFKRLISGTMSGEFVENEAIELGRQGLSYLPITSLIMPNIAKFSGGISHLDIETLEISAKVTDVGNDGIAEHCDKLRSLIMRRAPSGAIDRYDLPDSILCGEGAVYTDWGYVDEWKQRLESDETKDRLDYRYVNVYPLERYPVTDFSSIDDTWTEIITTSNAGMYRDRYAIGDTKRMDLADGNHVYMQLVAFDTDRLASDTTQTASMTWLLRGVMPYKRVMHATVEDVTWETSDLRGWLNDDLLSMMPSIVRRNVKTVRKGSFDEYTTYSSENSMPTTDPPLHYTDDKVWVPSVYEMYPSYRRTNGVDRFKTDFTYYTGDAASIYTYYWRSRYGTDLGGDTYWARDRADATSNSAKCLFYDVGGRTGDATAGPSYTRCNLEQSIMFGFCI